MKILILVIVAVMVILLIWMSIMYTYEEIKEVIYLRKNKKYRRALESQLCSMSQRLQSQELSNVSTKSYDDLLKESNDLIQFGSNVRVYFPARGII